MKDEKTTPTPLWKMILVIVLVIALPLFFSFVRNIRMQQALNSEMPVSKSENPKQ